MADRAKKVSKNPQQAPQKSALSGKAEAKKHARHVNIVQRTTSESLRLESGAELPSSASADGSSSVSSGSVTASGGGGGGAAGKHYQPAAGTSSVSMLNAAAVAAARKPKTSSFQITSVVTKTGPRISSSSGGAADNGEDSADDLDESHAEDSSRVTDIDTETPSFSEDTFSKEDVFFTTSDAIGSAPVIPTSSQYGLAIVAPNMPGAQNLADVHVSVTDAGINLMTNSKKDVDLKDIHHRNERFKVVKIESTEPFRRGRWICMDYLDHSTLQPTIEEGGEAAGDPAEGGDDVGTAAAAAVAEDEPQSIVSAVTASDEGAAAGATGAAVVVPPASANESPGQTLQQPLAKNEINTNSSSSNNGSSNCSSRNQTSHAQTMAHISTPQQQQQTAGTTITASTTSAASINPSTLTTGGSATTISNQTAPNPSVPVTGNVVVGIAAAAPVASASPASQQVSTVGGTTPPQVQAQQQQPQSQPAQYYAQFTEPTTTATQQHGATLPAALLAQSVTISNQNTQVAPPQSQPPQVAVQQQSVPAPAASATGGIISSSMSSNAALPQQLSVSVDASPQQETSSTFSPVTVLSQPSPVFVSPSSSQQLAAGDAVAVQQNAVPNGPVPDLPISVPDTDIGTTGGSMSTTQLDLAAITHQVSPTSESTATTEQQSTPGGDSTTASLMSPSTIAIAASVPGILPPAQQQLLQNIVAEDGTSNEDSESASGTSAVAIDNKIEQAMDLVKSHLMFAVREEVEVLKEKIAELMDRINQLEVENTILKANATQETLSQITAAVPPKVPPTNPQNGPVS